MCSWVNSSRLETLLHLGSKSSSTAEPPNLGSIPWDLAKPYNITQILTILQKARNTLMMHGNAQTMAQGASTRSTAVNGERAQQKASVQLDIIVVGAGISGLATAISSALSGHNVTVFESAKELLEVSSTRAAPSAPDTSRQTQLADSTIRTHRSAQASR